MSNTEVTASVSTTTVTVQENTVLIQLNNVGIQGIPGANNDPTYVTVRNNTGATLAKGTIVYISGANGNNVQVTPAIATGDSTSARTIGWLAADILNNGSGLCMVEGYLEGINTQGFTAGAQLYLSGTVAGGFTATKPQAPTHLVYVGVVTKVSAGDGHVFVKVQNGYELEELHNVQIINPTNAQVLAYDSATQLWKNATNAPDGVTSITATAPLTGGTITSTGSIGLDQTALSITKSQVSDFTSGTVTSASTAQQAGTAVYSVNSGTAVFSTTSGTAVTISGSITKSQVSDFGSGTVTSASTAQQSGTAVYALTAGTATYADTSGTATYATNSGTAVFATNASTAVTISGSITQSQVTNLTTDLAAKANLAGGNALTGAQTVTSSAVGQVPLTVTGATGQTGNLFSIRSDASELAFFSAGGNLNVFQQVRVGGSTSLGQLSVTSINAGNIGAVIRGASGQTADLLQAQSNAGSVLARIGAGGNIRLGTSIAGTSFAVNNDAFGASVIPVLIRGAASQTANLQEWQNSGGTVLARIDPAGMATVGALGVQGNPSGISYALFGTPSASAIPIVVRGAASQTAVLQSWQNSAGAMVSQIGPNGNPIFLSGLAAIQTANSGATLELTRMTAAVGNPGANIGRLYFRDGTNAGTLKLVVRAGASGAETTILDNIPQT